MFGSPSGLPSPTMQFLTCKDAGPNVQTNDPLLDALF